MTQQKGHFVSKIPFFSWCNS